MSGINVLSLFDGMSCGQIALERSGIEVNNYFASEIDKYAMKVTQDNYPDTIQLGDITKITGDDLPKIDLLFGGSPCTGFSFAGKQLNFEDPRSKLFFDFVRLLKKVNPRYWMLENVKMKKEYQDVISEYLGVEPVKINSNLVSAQNRNRLYWSNFDISQPQDKGIVLQDIVEGGESIQKKSQTIVATLYKENAKSMIKRNKLGLLVKLNGASDIINNSEFGRIYYPDINEDKITLNDIIGWRKFTPLECERLQTVKDNYTDSVSNTQRYKMLGNGWTVDIISHIFNQMNLRNIKSCEV